MLLTAREARNISGNYKTLLKRISRAIESTANRNQYSLVYNFDADNQDLVKRIKKLVKKLRKYGYSVTDHADTNGSGILIS